MDDLLKEAIADAKAVRETALANAKMALEEAFTPRLKSMLASKIANEVEGEEPEVEDAEEAYDEDDEVPVEPEAEMAPEEDEEVPVEPEAEEAPEEMMDAEEGEEEMEEEGVIEIDGVKYAPVVSEEEDEEEVEEGEEHGDAEEGEDELDLESILRELEEEEDKEDEELDENDVSSGIGKSDNAHNAESGDSSKVGQGPEGEGSDKEAGKELDDHEVVKEVEDKEEGEDEMDEDIDLEEVLKALSEEENDEEEVEEVATLKNEIKEHRDVVKYLRAKLNEVNLLNAKLLFSNKLFRTFGLTNEQKMKVVETFDRTKNLREIKLVYSTLAESFGQSKPAPIKESVRKGSSSKAVASTKPKKEVISEGDDLKARFKKLANII